MKETLFKIVIFFTKYFTLCKEYVLKVVTVLVKAWKWLVTLTTKQEFVFTYPLAVFTVVALCTHSIIMVVALLIWFIPFVKGINGKE